MAKALIGMACALIRSIPEMRGKKRLSRFMLRILRQNGPLVVIDRFGNTMTLPSPRESIAEAIFGSGVYQYETILAALRRLPPNGTYVDVGANVGAIGLPIARMRPDAVIVCIEASEEIAAVLRENVKRNGLTNVTVIEVIAGPRDSEEVAFYPAPKELFGMGSIGPQFGSAGVRLRQQRLDDLLDELGISTVHVVKMDVEGAELGVLQGFACRLQAARPPAVIFEFCDWAENRVEGQVAGDAQRCLQAYGYHLFHLRADGSRGAPIESPLTSGVFDLLAEHPAGWRAP